MKLGGLTQGRSWFHRYCFFLCLIMSNFCPWSYLFASILPSGQFILLFHPRAFGLCVDWHFVTSCEWCTFACPRESNCSSASMNIFIALLIFQCLARPNSKFLQDSPSSNAWPCSIWRYRTYCSQDIRMVWSLHAFLDALRGCSLCYTSCHSPRTNRQTCIGCCESARDLLKSSLVWTHWNNLGKSTWTSCWVSCRGLWCGTEDAVASWRTCCTLYKCTCESSQTYEHLCAISVSNTLETRVDSNWTCILPMAGCGGSHGHILVVCQDTPVPLKR